MPDVLDEVAEIDEEAPASGGPEIRSCGFEYEVRSENASSLTLEGYAAVFGAPARVVDWRGSYDETVERGSFRKTLSERKPLLMYEHGQHPIVGITPIGNLLRAAEDSRGVHVRGVVFKNWMTAPIVDGIRGDAIGGMSYSFIVPTGGESWSRDRSQRSIHEVKLTMPNGDDRMGEISITMAPVQTGTSVSLRSILALGELVGADPEIRAAYEAALSGTSMAAVSEPPPAHSVPEDTLALFARVLSRRRPVA